METSTASTTTTALHEPASQEPSATSRASLLQLFGTLTNNIRTLFRQELQLARTELAEKLSKMGRNAAALAAGGVIAYTGLTVFLLGLGWLLAWAYSLAGITPLFAVFLGMITIGLFVSILGGVLLLVGLKNLYSEPLAPERTLQTLQELKGNRLGTTLHRREDAASSAEMQARVEATETRMGATLDELGQRLSPDHLNTEIKQRIQSNPYRAGGLVMLAGFVSGLLLRRRVRHA